MTQMDIDSISQNTIGPSKTPATTEPPAPSWHGGTTVMALSGTIFQHLQTRQQMAKEAGDLEYDAPTYEKPEITIKKHAHPQPMSLFQPNLSLWPSIRSTHNQTF